MSQSTNVIGITVLVLLGVTGTIWFTITQSAYGGELRVTFLDVGQGDAIFIQSPSGAQMLIDGGKNRAVIRGLSRVMPLFDRSIDVVVGTHPDADHIGGLPDVLARYRVGMVIQSSVRDPEGVDAAAFEEAMERETHEGGMRLRAERGQVIDLGGGATFEILFPDRSLTDVETNLGSIVGRVQYGNTSFLLTSDSPDEIETYLVFLDAEDLRSNVLKVGHHGSRTSSAISFVGFVQPEYAVYSRGCDNSYGHPHGEVIDTFARFNIPTFDTCTEGNITFVSDGTRVVRK